MTTKEISPDGSEKKRKGKKGKEDLEEFAENPKASEPQAAPELKGEPLPEEMQVDPSYVNALDLFAWAVTEHLKNSLPRIAKMWNAVHTFFGDANVAFDSVLVEKYDGLATIPMIEHELNALAMEGDEDEYGESQDRVTPALLLILNSKTEIILYSRVAQQEICILSETDITDEELWEDPEALKSILAQIVAAQFSEYVNRVAQYEKLTADDLDSKIADFLRSAVDSNGDPSMDPQLPQPKKRVTFTKKKKK
ncbi:hypothetical protein KA078_03095 [Candidatus Woesebacteria bacterium]|nr:hypothetical protein [Candidatus Woesebacteria bacterium]